MASSKTTRSKLPKQFEPLLGQAQTQGALRYGAQETGLQSLLTDRNQTYQRQSAAQAGATRSLLGSYASAGVNLNNVYSDAGLTPEVRAKYAATPDGQRILASLARGQGDIQQQTLGAQAGGQFVQQRLGEDYQSDVGKIQGQQQAERTERGLYESSLLDQLIGDNRAARSKLNADARDRQAAADAATQSQTAAQTNALIGQGLLPDPTSGVLQPLPGGKADPNAPSNKPKRTTGPGTADAGAQRKAGTDFSKAQKLAAALKGNNAASPELIQSVAGILTNGKPASAGKPIYAEVPVLDAAGKPKVGADGTKVTKQVKVLWKKGDKDPAGQPIDPSLVGTAKTTSPRPATPQFEAPIASAAAEQALLGYVTTKTVRELQKLGYSVNQIPGLKTQHQAAPETKGRYGGVGRGADTTTASAPAPAASGGGNSRASGLNSKGKAPTASQVLANPQHYTPNQVASAKDLRQAGQPGSITIDKNGGVG